MVADGLRIPFADHLLVKVPEDVDPLRVAATSDNLADAWRCVVPPLRRRPGGICTGTGYYLSPGTKLPVMDMYATGATLHVGVSHVRPVLPELLDFIATTGFEAERVTSLVADWEDASEAYQARTTKVVLHREPLELAENQIG